MKENKPVGLTKDVGHQFGVRRTISVNLNKVWDFLLSNEGLNIWLGEIDSSVLVLNEPFTVPGKANCMFTVLKQYSHLRMKLQPLTCENFTTLQLRVIPNANRSTISFHTENLASEEQREKMKRHWTAVIGQLVMTLEKD